MKIVANVFTLVALIVFPYILQAQTLGDADNIIIRLRPVCHGGPGGGLLVAFDIYPRTPGNNRTIGAYSVVMGHTTGKITYLGTSRRYETGYWGGQFQNEQLGTSPGARLNQQQAGQGIPLTDTYFEPASDCSGVPLNDGFFEILRYSFSISPSASGTANILFAAVSGYRQAGQYVNYNTVTAVYYANPVNNGNDSTLELRDIIVPVELSSFASLALPDGTVELNWRTESETNNYGFELQRNTGNGWDPIDFIEGKGTVAYASDYSYTDSDVRNVTIQNNVVLYRLRQIDHDGTEAISQVSAVNLIPQYVGLQEPYPNPVFLGGQATIPYSLSVPAAVTLAVYNVLGERIVTLARGADMGAGTYQAIWNGRDELGAQVPAGMYFVRFSADFGSGEIFQEARQMQLIR